MTFAKSLTLSVRRRSLGCKRSLLLCILLLLAANAFAIPADSLKAQKKHKPSDTVGVVNKAVIYFADFRSVLFATMKTNHKDSVVSDSAYTHYVDITWNKLVSDALVEEEIMRRKLSLRTDQVITFLLKHPSKELLETFATPGGGFDTLACKKYLRSPDPDLVRTRFLDHYQIQFEQDRLFQIIAPRTKSEAERGKLLEEWLSKQIAKAKIIDRRSAFGYY